MARFVSRIRVPSESNGGNDPVRSHHLDALEHESEPQTENDANHHEPGNQTRDVRSGAGESQGQPQNSGDEAGTVDGGRRDHRRLCGLSRRDGADGFHRLHRKRGLVVNAADQHRGPESKQDAEGVDLQNGNVCDDKRNQCAEIAKGSRPFHSIEAITGRGLRPGSLRGGNAYWLPTKLGMMPGTTYCCMMTISTSTSVRTML